MVSTTPFALTTYHGKEFGVKSLLFDPGGQAPEACARRPPSGPHGKVAAAP